MHTARFKKKILRLKFAQQKSDEILNFAIFLEEDNPNSFFSFTVVRFLPLVIDHNHGYKSLPW